MPASNDKLFQLIHSLTRNEKRNFVMFTQLLQGEKEYLKLFEAIKDQKVYDEKALRETLKGAKMLTQLSVAKNYLYSLITRALQIFTPVEKFKFSSRVTQCEILIEKGLFSHAELLIRKLLQEAEKREAFEECLKLLKTSRLLIHKMRKTGDYESFLKQILQREKDIFQQQVNLNEYQNLHDQVLIILSKNLHARDSGDLKMFSSILGDPLIKSKNNAYSKKALFLRHLCLKNIWKYVNAHEKAYKEIEFLIELLEGNSFLSEEFPKQYPLEIGNGASMLYLMGKYSEANLWLEKLKAHIQIDAEESPSWFEIYAPLRLIIAQGIGNKEDGLAAIKEVEKGISLYGSNISPEKHLILCFILSQYYIRENQPNAGLPWVLEILNQPANEMRKDLQCYSRILHLSIFLQKDAIDSIQYYLKSYTRFIYKRRGLHEVEMEALHFFKARCKCHTKQEIEKLARKTLSDLKPILTDPFENAALNNFDFVLFLESLLANKSMAELNSERRDGKMKKILIF